MVYYAYDDAPELQHHGVEGQRWGVRNGPPYPINTVKKAAANRLYHELDKFEYGGIVNGKKITEPEYYDIDFGRDYRTIPVSVMEKEKIGNCWDFVNYQHAYFQKHGIKDKAYMFVMDRGRGSDDIVTHTFSTISLEDGNYWFEQAFYKQRGIHKINSIKDVTRTLVDLYGDHPFSVYTYNPSGMDRQLTDKQFFDRATRKWVFNG